MMTVQIFAVEEEEAYRIASSTNGKGGESKLSENEVPIFCISSVVVQSAHAFWNALPLSREKLSDVNVA